MALSFLDPSIPGGYCPVAASQTDFALGCRSGTEASPVTGSGARGDYLESLILTVSTAATAATSIKDGGGSALPIIPNSPGSGIGTYVVPIRAYSVNGPWKVTTGAGTTVVAIGRFS